MNAKANNITITNIADMASAMPVFGADIAALECGGPGIVDVDTLEAETLDLPHLENDIRHEDSATVHTCKDARKLETAIEHVGRIPAPNEAFHLVCGGRYAMWNMTPAVYELANPTTPPDCIRPIKIANLHLATLGFSRQNVSEMLAMLDAGAIGQLSLMCSHYFQNTSGGIYEYAAAELAKRPQARFLAIRSHCKLACIQLTDGRTVTIESSANLRSSGNIEQMSILGSPNLYAFHTGWMNDLFTKGGQHP